MFCMIPLLLRKGNKERRKRKRAACTRRSQHYLGSSAEPLAEMLSAGVGVMVAVRFPLFCFPTLSFSQRPFHFFDARRGNILKAEVGTMTPTPFLSGVFRGDVRPGTEPRAVGHAHGSHGGFGLGVSRRAWPQPMTTSAPLSLLSG